MQRELIGVQFLPDIHIIRSLGSIIVTEEGVEEGRRSDVIVHFPQSLGEYDASYEAIVIGWVFSHEMWLCYSNRAPFLLLLHTVTAEALKT